VWNLNAKMLEPTLDLVPVLKLRITVYVHLLDSLALLLRNLR
jgi:hypothetical protein